MLLLLAAALSCSKESVRTVGEVREKVDILFRSSSSATKSGIALSGPDMKVNTLDVLVFRAASDHSGALDAIGHSTFDEVTVSVTKGVRLSCRFVANAPEGAFSQVTTEAQFLSAVSLLADNTPTGMLMVGEFEDSFSASGSSPVVDLSFVSSKVVLDSVEPRFAEGYVLSSGITMDRAYLINVNGSLTYSLSPAATEVWHNKMQRETDLSSALSVLLEKELNVSVTSSSKKDVGVTLYCYPNTVNNGVTSLTTPLWSPRNTRLVLEITIGGEKNYYPVTLPAMMPGKMYRITDLVLLGFGSPSPDIPVERNAMRFSIDVNDWGETSQDVVLE